MANLSFKEKSIKCIIALLIQVGYQLPFYFGMFFTYNQWIKFKLHTTQSAVYFQNMVILGIGLMLFTKLCTIETALREKNKPSDECETLDK